MSKDSQLPPAALDYCRFELFNALSWQIMLGAPVILYVKSLGASATVLGIMVALTPLLMIFQIPAAHLLPKYGYRKFVLTGWSARTVCIFGLAALPWLGFLPSSSRLWLALLLLFIFNLLRGIATGGTIPWVSHLAPMKLMGRFLSRGQFFMQIGCLLSLAVATVTLFGSARPWQFSLLFLFSALAAIVSLLVLRRVPDADAEQIRNSGARVPWGAMVRYKPFFRIILLGVLYALAMGGVNVFAVAYLREEAHLSESLIVAISLFSVLGAIFGLFLTGRTLDRCGGKPIILCCLGLCVAAAAGWFALASHLLPHHVWICGAVMLVTGGAMVNYQVALNQMATKIIPLMGRNHFFAIFTVVTNVAAGLSPIGWGLLLDEIYELRYQNSWMEWNRFSVFFGLATLLAVVAAAYATRLIESPE